MVMDSGNQYLSQISHRNKNKNNQEQQQMTGKSAAKLIESLKLGQDSPSGAQLSLNLAGLNQAETQRGPHPGDHGMAAQQQLMFQRKAGLSTDRGSMQLNQPLLSQTQTVGSQADYLRLQQEKQLYQLKLQQYQLQKQQLKMLQGHEQRRGSRNSSRQHNT